MLACDDPISKAITSWPELIEAIAARFEPRLRIAFLAAVEAKREKVDVKALAKAYEANDTAAILSIVGITSTNLIPLLEPLRAIFQRAGEAVNEAPLLARASFAFDGINVRAIGALRDYGGRLIRQVTADQRAATLSVVEGLLRDGANPRTAASVLSAIVGLTDKQSAAVANYATYLRDLRNEALLRRLRDRRFDGQVRRAIQQGKPLPEAKITALVERYRARMLRFRGETIARTESIRAANLGAHEGFRQAAERGDVDATALRRFWEVGRDERTCPVCKEVPKLNARGVGMDEPFRLPGGLTAMRPTLHPRCRCTVSYRLRLSR